MPCNLGPPDGPRTDGSRALLPEFVKYFKMAPLKRCTKQEYVFYFSLFAKVAKGCFATLSLTRLHLGFVTSFLTVLFSRCILVSCRTQSSFARQMNFGRNINAERRSFRVKGLKLLNGTSSLKLNPLNTKAPSLGGKMEHFASNFANCGLAQSELAQRKGQTNTAGHRPNFYVSN